MTTSSPCVGICTLEDDICIGCGRTSAEIYQAGIDALEERPGDPPSATDERKTTEPTPVR